jgi:hypothetical protein
MFSRGPCQEVTNRKICWTSIWWWVKFLHRNSASRKETAIREASALRYNCPILLLKDINMGTWPYRLEESQIWDCNTWSWMLRDWDPKTTALSRSKSNCKLQTRPLASVNLQLFVSNKNLVMAPDGCPAPKQTGLPTVGCNITSTST